MPFLTTGACCSSVCSTSAYATTSVAIGAGSATIVGTSNCVVGSVIARLGTAFNSGSRESTTNRGCIRPCAAATEIEPIQTAANTVANLMLFMTFLLVSVAIIGFIYSRG